MTHEFEDAVVGWALSPELESHPVWTDARFNDCSCDALGCDAGTCFSCVAASCSEEMSSSLDCSNSVEYGDDDDPMEVVPITPEPPRVFVMDLAPYARRRPSTPPAPERMLDALKRLRCEERFEDFADDGNAPVSAL